MDNLLSETLDLYTKKSHSSSSSSSFSSSSESE
jgi:hypothetical protein